MPVGFEYYDQSGNVVSTTSSNTFKMLGAVWIDSASNPTGSLSNAEFALGIADFWYITATGNYYDFPTVSIAGTTLTWATQGTMSGFIYYGFW